MDYPGRLSRLQSGLEQNHLDSLLVTHLPNIRYLCGFTGSAGVLLVADRDCILFTDGRYRMQAKEEVSGAHFNKVNIVVTRKSPLLTADQGSEFSRAEQGEILGNYSRLQIASAISRVPTAVGSLRSAFRS